MLDIEWLTQDELKMLKGKKKKLNNFVTSWLTFHVGYTIASHPQYRKEIPELYSPLWWHHRAWSSNLGYSDLCLPHMRKLKQTQCVHDLCVPCSISDVFIFTLRLQYIHTWRIMFILLAGETQIPPIGAHAGIKMAQGSEISRLYLWSHLIQGVSLGRLMLSRLVL